MLELTIRVGPGAMAKSGEGDFVSVWSIVCPIIGLVYWAQYGTTVLSEQQQIVGLWIPHLVRGTATTFGGQPCFDMFSSEDPGVEGPSARSDHGEGDAQRC